MEILDRLPDDLKWNVIKYLRHPVAELFTESVIFDRSFVCIKMQRGRGGSAHVVRNDIFFGKVIVFKYFIEE
jgi:hypothetical protein